MQIAAINALTNHNRNYLINNNHRNNRISLNHNVPNTGISFEGNILSDIFCYIKAQKYAVKLATALKETQNPYIFRQVRMEPLEGIQFGIPVFNGLTMKDIQYLAENLHVIAVKRGCNHMCGHCYADAKPSNRQMSWEDFTRITGGFKKLTKRLGGIDIYGTGMTKSPQEVIYRTTELFYDADCMDLALKDKKGNIHDFIDLSKELYTSLGRKTVFDTSGWDIHNKKLQSRAEKYAEFFSKPKNMERLEAFNISFNVFNASYIASVKAKKAGDIAKAERLREKFTNNMANVLYTFTPLFELPQFHVMARCFDNNAKNAYKFGPNSMMQLIEDVINKVAHLYEQDLNGAQKFIKSESDINKHIELLFSHLNHLDTNLNSVGRMRKFMDEFKIKADMQDHTESTKIMIENLKEEGRFHHYIAHRLIDTDGKVYHMDYARFFPTEIQLNLKDKNSVTPRLANLIDRFVISKDIINRPEP